MDRLGVLTLVWTLIGYFSIFDLGLGRALTHRIAALRSEADSQKIDDAISFGMGLVLTIGLLGLLLVCLTINFLGISWLNVGAEIYQEAYWSIFVASLGIPLATMTSGLKGVLEGFEKFQNINLLRTALGIFNFLFPVIAVELYGPNLVIIVIALLIARVFIFFAHIYLVKKLLRRPIYFRFRSLNDGSKKLLQFGIWMTLSNIVSPLMAVADRFFISHFNGSASVAYYSIPFDFIFRLLILPAAITTTLFPIFSKELKQQSNAVRHKYLKCQLFIIFFMLPVCGLVAIFSHFGLSLWMGADFADQSYMVASLIAIGVFFNSLGQAPLTLLQADGRVKFTSILHLLEFVFYAPLLILAILNFGIIGAAVAWLIRVLVDCLLLNIAALKLVKFNHA